MHGKYNKAVHDIGWAIREIGNFTTDKRVF